MTDGETESGLAALRGFCLLNSLLTSLSRMEKVITVEGEEGGGSEVGSCEKAVALAEVGGLQLMGWGWRVVLRGMVCGLFHCPSKRQSNSFKLLARRASVGEWGALGLQLVINLSPFQTEAESLAENWCRSFSEYSSLASLTSFLNLYFDSTYLSLSPLLNASAFSNLDFLSLTVNQGLSLL